MAVSIQLDVPRQAVNPRTGESARFTIFPLPVGVHCLDLKIVSVAGATFRDFSPFGVFCFVLFWNVEGSCIKMGIHV